MSFDRPLASFERTMLRVQRHQPFNIVARLELTKKPSIEACQNAVDRLVERHPALTATFVEGPRWSAGEAKVEVEAASSDGAEDDRDLQEAGLNREFDLERGPLLAVQRVVAAEGSIAMLFTMPHLVADDLSLQGMLEEFVTLLEGIDLDAPPPQLPDLDAAFPPAWQGFAGKLKGFAALAAQIGSELSFAFRSFRHGLPKGTSGASNVVSSFELDELTTKRLAKTCRRLRVTMNGLVTAATLVTWSRHIGGSNRRPARCFQMAGLRPRLNPKIDPRSLGGLFAMLRTTWNIGNDDDVIVLARQLDANLEQQLKNEAHFKAWRSSEAMMKTLIQTRVGRMGEVAVSYTPSTSFRDEPLASAVKSLQAWVSTIDVGPSLVAQVTIWRGKLTAGLVCSTADLDRVALDAASNTLVAIFENLAKNNDDTSDS